MPVTTGSGGGELTLYAIGDLHLSFAQEKPMDIFGDLWENHAERVKEFWLSKINDQDTVLVPGDISWALRLEDAHPDLEWLNALPGRKILVKGNHDYWWQSKSKLNQAYPDMIFLQNTYDKYEGYAICGTRGWLCPNSANFTEHDHKIYKREVLRLENSLEQAAKDKWKKIIVMMHYPPTNEKHEASDFTQLTEAYQVEKVIYAHLHGEKYYRAGLQGVRNGVEYHLVSCDYLRCNPLIIL